MAQALATLAGLSLYLAAGWTAVAQDKATCDSVTGAELLNCAASLIDAAKASGELGEPLRKALDSLGATEGYGGASADLEKFKGWAKELKDRDPVANRLTIAALDNAIASHKDEIRTAVSVRAAARQALENGQSEGDNIQPIFVQRKLTFLDSDRAKFYDRGPFEVARLSLLASAIEEHYFLNGAATRTCCIKRSIS